MNSRLLDLAVRRGMLKMQIHQQRATLAWHSAPLADLLAHGDTALRGVAWLKARPLVVVSAAACLAALRPRQVWRWAKRGVFVWRAWLAARKTLFSGR